MAAREGTTGSDARVPNEPSPGATALCGDGQQERLRSVSEPGPNRVPCVNGFNHHVVIQGSSAVVASRCTRCGAVLCHRTRYETAPSKKAIPFLIVFDTSTVWVRACAGTTPAILAATLGVHGGLSTYKDDEQLPSECDLHAAVEPGAVLVMERSYSTLATTAKARGKASTNDGALLSRLLGRPAPVRRVLEMHIRYVRLPPRGCVAVFEKARQVCPRAKLKTLRLLLASYAVNDVPLPFQAKMLAVPLRTLIRARRSAVAGLQGYVGDQEPLESEGPAIACLMRLGWFGPERQREVSR